MSTLNDLIQENHGLEDEIQYLREIQKDLLKALDFMLRAYEEMMPGVFHIPVDIGLINEAGCKARAAIAKVKGKA